MDAFKGSVLFAGLPDARAPLATSSAATPAPAAKNLPPVIETNVETLPQGFSLTLPSAPEERPAGGAATLAEGEPGYCREESASHAGTIQDCGTSVKVQWAGGPPAAASTAACFRG